MGNVKAVCVSPAKGTQKTNVGSALFIEDWGIENDAHAGKWHRQVSLLSRDRIEEYRAKGADVSDGAFGENLVVSGIDFRTLPVGTRFGCGEVLLELTQIGKECHSGCEIYKQMGDCIMPREGVFARVLRGGRISVGDTLTVLPAEKPKVKEGAYSAAVVTVSDRCARGERTDEGGPLVAAMLKDAGYEIAAAMIVPDERAEIEAALIGLADSGTAELIVTTGGTGFAPRDVTPEATKAVCDRLTSGIPEAMRAASMRITPRAMLSRAEAGIRGGALIVNLPGSPKAARENLEAVLPALDHGLQMLRGGTQDCAKIKE